MKTQNPTNETNLANHSEEFLKTFAEAEAQTLKKITEQTQDLRAKLNIPGATQLVFYGSHVYQTLLAPFTLEGEPLLQFKETPQEISCRLKVEPLGTDDRVKNLIEAAFGDKDRYKIIKSEANTKPKTHSSQRSITFEILDKTLKTILKINVSSKISFEPLHKWNFGFDRPEVSFEKPGNVWGYAKLSINKLEETEHGEVVDFVAEICQNKDKLFEHNPESRTLMIQLLKGCVEFDVEYAKKIDPQKIQGELVKAVKDYKKSVAGKTPSAQEFKRRFEEENKGNPLYFELEIDKKLNQIANKSPDYEEQGESGTSVENSQRENKVTFSDYLEPLPRAGKPKVTSLTSDSFETDKGRS